MNFTNFSISELQSFGITGDEEAITELGRRVLDIRFCGEAPMCDHEIELADLQDSMCDNEIPEECPHCGKYI